MLWTDYLPACSCHALNLLWAHYIERLALEGVSEHALNVFHAQLGRVRWRRLFPDMHTLEVMVKVRQ